ncbi:MAG: DUF4364 family protein [Lachnospiraceae bacterium]|nr:DUF4364 family protein [Lachnospiraceae bacterium]
MISEPTTLYKLMVLYMLKRVNFPLSNGQMSEFFLDKSYTNYFTFQQVINDLQESSLIRKETVRNTSLYEMTKEGEEVLYYFENKLSDVVKQDIEEFLEKNRFELRMENSILADYYKTTGNDYEVHCEVREGKRKLIDLKMSAATEEIAEQICENWQKKSQEVYSYLIHTMLG